MILILVLFLFKAELIISILGSFNIIAIFLSVFVLFSSGISYFSYTKQREEDKRNEFPVLAILVILLIVYSGFDLNDNHRIRQVASPTIFCTSPEHPKNCTPPIPILKNSFELWKEARIDDIKKI